MADTAVKQASDAPRWCTTELGRRAWEVGSSVAALYADEVDRDGRFPAEAIQAMRESGLLGAMVPVEAGGGGANLAEVSESIRAIAAHCASSALVLAMHQSEVANVIRHGATPKLKDLLRSIGEGMVLVANGNSEVGHGGDISRSFCGFDRRNGKVHLEKDVLALSYAEHADVITVIAVARPRGTRNRPGHAGLRPRELHRDRNGRVEHPWPPGHVQLRIPPGG